MKRVVGFGAGGHAGVVLEILRASDDAELIGLIDSDPALKDHVIHGTKILGDDQMLDRAIALGATHFFVAVGMVRTTPVRRRLFELALARGLEALTVIHRTAVVSPSVALGRGVTILAGAIVNTAARLGDNVIVNTGAIVEHDCQIGDHAHVATGAKLSGDVVVGRGAMLGIGCVVRQGVRISTDAVVGAGAVVLADVAAGATVVGVPARKVPSHLT